MTGRRVRWSRVPSEFAAMIASREGRPGRAWISALPDRVEDLLDAWALRVDGPTRSGYVAIVVPVMCADGTSAVLKVSYPDEESRSEGPALRTCRRRRGPVAGAELVGDRAPARAGGCRPFAPVGRGRGPGEPVPHLMIATALQRYV